VLVVSDARLQLPREVQSLPGSAGADSQMPYASIRVHACQLAQAPEVRRKQREAACHAMWCRISYVKPAVMDGKR